MLLVGITNDFNLYVYESLKLFYSKSPKKALSSPEPTSKHKD